MAHAALSQQFLQPLLDANQALEDRAAYEREYGDLLQNGALPALAEQLATADQLEKTQLRLLELEQDCYCRKRSSTPKRSLRDNGPDRTATQGAGKDSLRLLKGQAAVLDEDARCGDPAIRPTRRSQIQAAESPEARRQRAINQYNTRRNERESETRPFEKYMEAKADLEDLIDPLNQVMSATDALGNAFGDAFQDIISGSESADEALKKMFANIGSYFLNMAAQILAQQALTSILGLLGGGLGAAAGGGGSGFLTGGLFNTQLSYAGGGYTGDGARSGGVDGQGGFPAILHPQETVIDHTIGPRPQLRPADEYGMGEPTAPEITYTGAVLNFNGNEYVSKADVPRIIKGAVAATGKEMRNSVSYRRRAGI